MGLGLCGMKLEDNQLKDLVNTLCDYTNYMKVFKINNCPNRLENSILFRFLDTNRKLYKLGLFGVSISKLDKPFFIKPLLNLKNLKKLNLPNTEFNEDYLRNSMDNYSKNKYNLNLKKLNSGDDKNNAKILPFFLPNEIRSLKINSSLIESLPEHKTNKKRIK